MNLNNFIPYCTHDEHLWLDECTPKMCDLRCNVCKPFIRSYFIRCMCVRVCRYRSCQMNTWYRVIHMGILHHTQTEWRYQRWTRVNMIIVTHSQSIYSWMCVHKTRITMRWRTWGMPETSCCQSFHVSLSSLLLSLCVCVPFHSVCIWSLWFDKKVMHDPFLITEKYLNNFLMVGRRINQQCCFDKGNTIY